MKVLSFSPRAAADLDGIWDYSAENWGPAQADRYIDELRDTCRALASGQKRGRDVSARPGYWKYPCGAHVIYFRDPGETLEIIRILHGAQDVERNLHE